MAASGVAGVVLLLALIGGQATRAAAPNPPVTAGLQLWYEADTTTYADGQAVTTWADKAGSARDLTSSSTLDAPIMRRNAVNGRAAIEFDGVQSLMKTYGSTFTFAQPDTFFVVYRSLDANTSARAFVFDSTDATNRQVFGKSNVSTSRLYANIDLDMGGIAYPFSDFQIWSGAVNGTSSSLFQNGVQVGSGNAGGASLTGFTVGALSSTAQYGYDYSHIQVAEILYYRNGLTQAQRNLVNGWLNEKYNLIPPATPPVNTAAPTLTGTAQAGVTVTAATGTWNGTPPLTFTYQWQLCNSAGASCTNISGAIGANYTIPASAIGSTLAVSVTATNSAGSAAAVSVPVPVTAAPPVNTLLPSITGFPQVGSTLTGARGTWTGTATITFTQQWLRCDVAGAACAPVAGATALTRVLAAADVGSTLRIEVTASNAAGNVVATSAQTGVIAATGGASVPPFISGLQLWYEANTEPYADGQAVTTWTDKSGFGRNLRAFDSSQAPVFHRNTVNGRAAIEFDGVRSLLKTYDDTFTLAQPDTFFVVYRSLDEDTAPRGFVFDSRDSTSRQVFGRPSPGAVRMYANVDFDLPGVMYPFEGFQAWSGTFNGASSVLYKNGSLYGVGDTGTAGERGLTVGGLSTSAQYGYDFSHSQVAEILYYTGSLSDANRLAVTTWLDQKYNVVGPPSPPGNLVAPKISGTPRDGSTLTATSGYWSGTLPLTYAYQWRRCDASGLNCANIAGATSVTYVATAADVGSTITVVVTATNSVGSASAAAAVTVVVAALPPVLTSAPTLSGTPREGSTLTTANGAWGGTAPLTYAYQWNRCDAGGLSCVPIPGAIAQSYLLATADVGFTIRAVVTASNPAGNVPAASPQTPAIVAVSAPAPPSLQPPVTAGLQLWFEADTEQYAEGQGVGTWQDKSGLGRNLTAFAPSQAPVFHRNFVSGRAAIEFDGVTSMLKTYSTTFTLTQPTTFFIVYRSLDPDTAVRAFVFDSRNSTNRQILGRGAAGEVRMYGNNGLSASGVAYPFPSFMIWNGTFNGATSSLYRNGVVGATGNAGGASQVGFTLGGLSTSAQYGYDMSHSQIAEILYYSGNLNAADRQAVTAWLDQKYGAIGPLVPPAIVAAPTIAGTLQDGSTLTSTTGAWSGSQPLTYAYQWRRCDGSGLNCSDIAAATSPSYTLVPADVASTIAVVVTATNGIGVSSASSAPTGVVLAAPPANTAPPTISGSPRETSTLTAANGTWSGTPPVSFAYEWRRCDTGGLNCVPIPSATAQTYPLVTADVGSTIRVAVTGSNVLGSATATSAQTIVVVSSTGPPPSVSPPVTAGLQLWYEADTEAYTEGQTVPTWTDKSGFGRNLTAFAPNQAPVFHQNAVNGHSAIEFDGATSLLKTYSTTFTLAEPTTFFVVYRSLDAATSAVGYVFDSRDSSNRQIFGRGVVGDVRMYANIPLSVPGNAYPFSTYQIWSGTFNGVTSSLYKNGALAASGNAGASTLTGFTVGALSTSGQYGYSYGHSLVAEILYYTGAMSDPDRAAVSAWLNLKYAAY